MNMKLACVLSTAALSLLLGSVEGNDVDQFNYGDQNKNVVGNKGTSYGQQSWDKVTCDNVGQCVSKDSKSGFRVLQYNSLSEF
jgi:hypothetical protein